MSTTVSRSYEELPGLEYLGPVDVDFEVTSFGSPSNYVDPGDSMEFYVDVVMPESDEHGEFSPIGALKEWLEERFMIDPPYEGDYCDDDPYY